MNNENEFTKLRDWEKVVMLDKCLRHVINGKALGPFPRNIKRWKNKELRKHPYFPIEKSKPGTFRAVLKDSHTAREA